MRMRPFALRNDVLLAIVSISRVEAAMYRRF